MNSFKEFNFTKFSMKSFSISVFLFVGIFIFNIFSINLVQAQNFDFYRSLKIGDSGQDVLELQKILNLDSDTTVAQSGVGSIGKETIYFGQLTKNALIRFQNKYRNEVLTPVDLSVGTGYFGPSTISFIENKLYSGGGLSSLSNQASNSLLDQQVVSTSKSFEELLAEVVASRENAEQTVSENINHTSENNITNDSINDSDGESIAEQVVDGNTVSNLTTDQSKLVRSDSMEVYFISQNVFETGQELTVVGTGINNDSEIYFFNFENDNVVSSVDIDSNFIFFDAPNLPEGKYEIYIKNGNLISKPLVVKIVDDYNPPKISSISPSAISYGDTVTIKGSNFESQNSILTALGTYQAASNSSGTEVKFVTNRFTNLPTNDTIVSPKEQKLEGIIQVQNLNGISDAELVDFIYN